MRHLTFCLVLPLLLLTGCALTSTAPPVTGFGASLRGNVLGGQQPVVGAHVHLLAANITGYGGYGIAASSLNASISLLNPADTMGLTDSIGAYVLTDSTGGFTITGDYTCTSGQQVYLYTTGGDPGFGGPNSAAAFLAVLGNCPVGGSFDPSIFVWINEVSTIAAAYAFAGFATDATHVSSSGTPLALTGIANAFANAARLAPLSTGIANTTYGAATVPQTVINTLANILASCVNSTGPGSPACTTLLADALSSGTTGTAPSDTATAAINMAHNPVANIHALYGLTPPIPPFNPALTAEPADLTIDLTYSAPSTTGNIFLAADSDGSILTLVGTTLTRYSGLGVATVSPSANVVAPNAFVIDPSHNVWVADSGTGFGNTAGFVELSSSGGALHAFFDPTLTGITNLAIDSSSNAWGISLSHRTLVGISSTGALLPTNGTFVSQAGSSFDSIAVMPGGDLWLATLNGAVHVTNPTSTTSLIQTLYGAVGSATGAAIDHGGKVWFSSGGRCSCTIVLDSATGTLVSPGSGYTGGGQGGSADHNPQIDGDGNSWNISTNFGYLSELSNTGSPMSGNGFLSTLTLRTTAGPVLDGSGNVWAAMFPSNMPHPTTFQLIEVIGASAPVVTPLSAGVTGNTLGTRP